MKTLYLIGFMGSGKSTVGRLLGKVLDLPFMDMDDEIVGVNGKSINQIFKDHGEEYFRNLETGLLESIPSQGGVIATGGGVVLREKNRKLMKETGIIIYLEATETEILTRLKGDESRPLLAGKKEVEIRKRLSQRLPLYTETADIQIKTDGGTPEQIVSVLIDRLKGIEYGHTC
ncbi:shikimate kinase [Neobacillus notoginsengisoli]|nr:shikimate kinase [Neobacillus notoginsengisoli]